LVDTIPLLNHSKKDVVLFFRGAGVPYNLLEDIAQRLTTAPHETNKFEITRSVLDRLNTRGEATLRERREVLRRVVDFTTFDSCWPDDQLKVKGLVASVREVVNQKDAFTRMNQARKQERQIRLAQAEEAKLACQQRAENIEAAKKALYGLFSASLTPHVRGKKLEVALNSLFHAYGILVQEAFHLVGESGEGIVEQIDGVVELKGILYFVEMKWYKEPVGKAEIAEHLVRLISRAESRGLFISASNYTEPAMHMSKEFLQHKIIALINLQEIVQLLEYQDDLTGFLLKKVHAAQIHKNPYFKLL
jgi:restriction endonuclease Mrr